MLKYSTWVCSLLCGSSGDVVEMVMTVYVDLESDTDHLSISSPQASQREDSYEETIRDLTQRLKDVSILLFA